MHQSLQPKQTVCIMYVYTCIYTGWFKMMDSNSYVYISWTIHGMWMIYITFERGGLNFQIPPLERSPSAQPCSSVSWEQNGYYAAQDYFAFVSSLRLSRRLLCSVRFVFVSTFSLQRGRAFVVGITNLSKQAVCVKAKARADHVYQRRTWDVAG